MTLHEAKTLFAYFLYKNNALIQFRYYTRHTYKISKMLKIVIMLNPIPPLVNPNEWLISAFCWEETNEGKQFWKNLNNKWQQILKNLEQNDNI